MRRISFAAIAAFITLYLAGCQCDDSAPPSVPNAPGAARISFAPTGATVAATRAAAISRPGTSRAADPSADFEMGDLNKSSTYLFLLQNSGTAAATNVQLTADDPAVTITPSVIGILSPTSSGGVQPIIQVSVQHGTSVSGVGAAPVLTAGRRMFNISATAADSAVTATASLGMTVRVTSFTISGATGLNSGNGILFNAANTTGVAPTLTTSTGSHTADSWGRPDAFFNGNTVTDAFWGVAGTVHATPVQITNTGNAPFTVNALSGPAWPQTQPFAINESVGTLTVNPGDTVYVDPEVQSDPVWRCAFKVTIHTVIGADTLATPDNNGDYWGFVLYPNPPGVPN